MTDIAKLLLALGSAGLGYTLGIIALKLTERGGKGSG